MKNNFILFSSLLLIMINFLSCTAEREEQLVPPSTTELEEAISVPTIEKELPSVEEEEAACAPARLDLTVEGILWGTDEPCAIIDGEVYSPGDEVTEDGVRLVAIEANSLILSCQGREVRMGVESLHADTNW